MSNTLKLTFGYEGTDSKRVYSIPNIDSELAPSVKGKIKALNASLQGGTSDGLNNFFRADDFDAAEGIGTFKEITAAQWQSREITVINLDTDEDTEGEG